MCSLNRCVAEQSRSVSPRRTLVSPLAGGYGSAASAVLRKQYHSDLKSKIGLKGMKCAEVLQIAMDVAGEEQSRLQRLDKLSDEGMTSPTNHQRTNSQVSSCRESTFCFALPRKSHKQSSYARRPQCSYTP